MNCQVPDCKNEAAGAIWNLEENAKLENVDKVMVLHKTGIIYTCTHHTEHILYPGMVLNYGFRN